MNIFLIILGLTLSLYGSLRALELPLKTWLRMTAVFGGISERDAEKVDKEFKYSLKISRIFLIIGTLFQIIGSLL